jgi:hypothetical protein
MELVFVKHLSEALPVAFVDWNGTTPVKKTKKK